MTGAAAASERDAQLWTTAIANGPVSGDLLAWVELQLRVGDDVSRVRQSKLRVALGYRVSDSVAIYAGYARVDNHRPGGATEQRLWQQIGYPIAAVGGLRLTGRTRIEQRTFEGHNDLGWRLRQQVRLALPLGAGRAPGLVGSAELLVALDDTDWGARRGVDQLRSYAGVTVPVGSAQAVEVGYLNQYVRRSGAADQVNHVAVMTLSHRF